MKRLIITSFFLFIFVLCLPSYSIVFDTGNIGLDSNDTSLNLGVWGMKIDSPFYSFGQVDTSGDIARINNPHHIYSKGLYFSLPKKDASLFASTIHWREYWFAFLYGERNGGGVGYEGKDIRAFLYSFMKGSDGEIQKSYIDRKDLNVLYLGVEGEKDIFSFSSLFSITDTLFISSMIKGGIDVMNTRINVGYGRLQSLLKDSKDWETSFEVSLYKDDNEVTFSLLLSSLPVYISSYRSLSFSSKGVMKVGKVKMESETKRNFVKGKEDVDASFSISCSIWKIKISKKEGLTLSFHFDSSSFTLSKEKMETKVVLRKDDIEMTFESSGKTYVKGRIENKE